MRKYSFEILLVAPLVIFLFGFTLLPILQTIFLSLTNYLDKGFPSFESFKYIFSHFQFREALFNTLFITFIGLSFEFIFGLGLALLLLEKFRGRKFFRAIMLLPLGIPTIVVAANMRYLFDTNGFLNELLYRIGLINLPIDWLGGGLVTLFSIAMADMWKVTPLVMLILLSGLESIPSEVLEAAEIDGASYRQRLRFILMPYLKPFITMALIIRGIDAFRIFELPMALTGRATRVLASYSFFEYRDFNNVYTSAASAVVLMLIILVGIGVYLKLSRVRA